MSELTVSVENLSKEYRRGIINHGTLRQDFESWWARLCGREDPNSLLNVHRSAALEQKFLALDRVNFEVSRGEILGIVGRNGAGKSTLLKVLSRITAPTAGRARLRGRVASLLEVGTGFHPEFTGRENIFLNGAILGMTKAEIRRKLDEIVAFGEVEAFLDTPVKRYSSGMYVRLAFAVAAHLEPEILIVDEVLAVGDAGFQKKCLGKMGQVGREGRTVLFVSHNMTALQSLCERAIWLDSGRVRADGPAVEIVADYLSQSAPQAVEQCWEEPASAPGNDKVRMRLARVVAGGGDFSVASPLRLEFEFWNLVPAANLNFSLHLATLEGVRILNTASSPIGCGDGLVRGVCHIPGDFLNDDVYRVSLMVVEDTSVPIYRHDDILVFGLHDIERSGNWFGKWPGIIRPHFRWETAALSHPADPDGRRD